MLLNDSNMIIEALVASEWRRDKHDNRSLQRALQLYRRIRRQALASRIWQVLCLRSRELYDLSDLSPSVASPGYERVGICSILLEDIRGSECKALDFDSSFRPLADHNRVRWLRVAAARLAHQPLPPVNLIQVGKVYFVRDGHHRISVARALGQRHIDARVKVWHVRGTLPWEETARQRATLGRPVVYIK